MDNSDVHLKIFSSNENSLLWKFTISTCYQYTKHAKSLLVCAKPSALDFYHLEEHVIVQLYNKINTTYKRHQNRNKHISK